MMDTKSNDMRVGMCNVLKKISELRRKLHLAYEVKNSFSDLEIYGLSVQLDELIVEYQKRKRAIRQQKLKTNDKGTPTEK